MALIQVSNFRRWFTFSFALLCMGFYIYYAFVNLDKIPPLNVDTPFFMVALLSIAFAILNVGLVGLIWSLLLRDSGVLMPLKQTLTIFAISQLGKYLPGNIGQHVGRVVIGKHAGIPVGITLSTMLIEALWGVGVGGALALLALTTSGARKLLGSYIQLEPLFLGIGTVIFLLLPLILIPALNHFFPTFSKRLTKGNVNTSPKILTALMVITLFLLCFVFMGIILKLQAQWFFGTSTGSLIELTIFFAVAWLSGYLIPGAPGGLGVREAMMVLLLSPVVGTGTAVGLGITLRVTTTLSDSIVFILGLVIKSKFKLNGIR